MDSSNYQMSKDTYTLGKQQLLYKLAIHPVHRKISRYTSTQNLLTTRMHSSVLLLNTAFKKTCISLVELCAIIATDLQAVALVSNKVARKVDTLIGIIISEKFVFAYCEGGIFPVQCRALVRVLPKKIV